MARDEYQQLQGVLEKRCRVFQIRDLLTDILANDRVRAGLVRRICQAEEVPDDRRRACWPWSRRNCRGC